MVPLHPLTENFSTMVSTPAAIEIFRHAAVTPSQWPAALDTLSIALRSDGASLVFKETTADTIAYSNSIASLIPEYLHKGMVDSREGRVYPRLEEGFITDFHDFTAQEIAHDPFYQEFLAPRGFAWHASAALSPDLVLSLKRRSERGVYDGTDLDTLQAALPLLRSASRVATMAWRARFEGELSAFERIDRGALLLSRSGRILSMNAAVQLGDGFDIRAGQLHAERAADTLRLRHFLAALIGRCSSPSGANTMILPRPSGRRAWLFDGIACADALRSLHSDATALVLITDLERRVRTPAHALTLMFGLSRTECALSELLVVGYPLGNCAERLHISEGHARQRLQSIFDKTRTSRQGELIALLSKLA
jgi:DNA-binding CsgD family transcriptional regulator